jgi:dienelactone hydrolase
VNSRRWFFALVAVAALWVPAAVARATAPAGSGSAPVASPPAGLPDDVPLAAVRPEPALPAASGWNGSSAFPRTSGTGRLADGAFLWTDYLYDDHGAVTVPGGDVAEAGTPSFGGYTYPAGPAHNNGADVFRAGVLLDGDATVWRVDWNTLADARVPIAEWTFDTDDRAATGASAWPAGAGVSSPGIEKALVVSSRGARLVDAASGKVLATMPVTVDTAAKSFVVRVPRTVLAADGAWRVRLAAGLADAAGTAFAPAGGALPGEPSVYNVAFRSAGQEASDKNMWNDNAQSVALTTGDVSAFSAQITWSDLAARRTTPEAAPRGWSDRWYVSSIDLGPGERVDPGAIADGKPNYLGRVQPYAVYVPASYEPGRPAPLTFLLHSLTQNHNQYAATTPKFTQEACEARRSICVTTLGRGPSGNFLNEAELDFWEVWNRVATTYSLDPDRTVIAGYSMGGFGANRVAMAHPDLFARSVLLAGAAGGNQPGLDNLRWVPTYLAGGAADELVPVTDEIAQAQALDARGFRYRYLLYPAEDHVAFELQDGFADAAQYMGAAVRQGHPGHVTYRWSTADDRPAFGIGTTGAYWLRDLRPRVAGGEAVVDAVSAANPDPAVTDQRSHDVLVPGDPTPAVVTQLTWQVGAAPDRRPAITMSLGNVGALTVRLSDAGVRPGEACLIDVGTDGPVTVTFVRGDGTTTQAQFDAGSHDLHLPG